MKLLAKIINFKKRTSLLIHQKNQDEAITKLIKANKEIEKELREWQAKTKKKIGIEPFHKLPEHIQELLNHYQVNDYILVNKFDIYLPENF